MRNTTVIKEYEGVQIALDIDTGCFEAEVKGQPMKSPVLSDLELMIKEKQSVYYVWSTKEIVFPVLRKSRIISSNKMDQTAEVQDDPKWPSTKVNLQDVYEESDRTKSLYEKLNRRLEEIALIVREIRTDSELMLEDAQHHKFYEEEGWYD